MKRYFALLMAVALVTAVAGCGQTSSAPAPSTAPSSAPAAPAATPVAPAPAPATPATPAPDAANAAYIELAERLDAEEYGIGFRKGDIAFGLEVQKHLDAMIADGSAVKISETWFGKDALLKGGKFLKEDKAPEGDQSLQAILAKKKIVVGLDDSYPPMGFRNDKNEIVGFDIDLAREVAKRMGVEIEFQPIDWDSKELELNAGKIDCIWNGMSITPERLENMFFAKSYIANEQIIVVTSTSDITTKAQLEGKVIGLQKGSSSLVALQKDEISKKVGSIVEYPDNVAAFMDLKVGRIDVLVVDSVVGRYVMKQNS